MNTNSLLWKMTFPILTLFVIIIIFMLYFIPSQMSNSVVNNTVQSSQQTVQQYKVLRKYYVQNVIAPILKSEDIRPNIDHADNEKSIPLPATMIHDLSKLSAKEGTSIKLYSDFPFPNRANRQLDDFQKQAWAYLNKNPNGTFVKESEKDGQQSIRVAIADKMIADACVSCHNSHPKTPKNNWNMDDVRGVLEVETIIEGQLATGNSTALLIILIILTTLISAVAILFIVYKKAIGSRLENINQAMNEIAHGDGDLTQRLDEKGNDELAALTKNFNFFISNLQNLIQQLKGLVHKLTSDADEMQADANNELSRITIQKEETEHTAAAINELVATVQSMAQNTSEAKQAADSARNETEIGMNMVDETTQTINDLARTVAEASNSIKKLKEGSDNIGTVLDVIRNIAEQTNLLALNAAIEAARAGEHGRGFAVVADEVRNLASKTQSSTLEIQNIIETLQSGTVSAVQAMEHGRTKAESSVTQVSEAGQSLNTIEQTVTTIADMNTQIASAVEEESTVTSEIERNIMNISNSTSVSTDAANKNATTAQNLASLSSDLEHLTSRFKT